MMSQGKYDQSALVQDDILESNELDENKILEYIQGLFELIEINNFNSFYYLVSRIINARIAAEENSEPQYDSLINQIASEVSSFINMGNYSPTKLYVFKKL